MTITSSLSPKVYLFHMKERMGERFDWGSERFTGCFIGRFFYVTHHAGHEWNRRITSQKNAAMGYVKKTENGSEIRFLRFQSMLCPGILLPYLVLFALYIIITFPVMKEHPLPFILTILIIVGMPLLYTAFEIMTDGSIDGRKCLMGLLIDPSDFFACLNHQNEIRE